MGFDGRLAGMTSDLQSIGLGFDRWQDAVEAAIASDNLEVTGEVRGGQLVQFTDPSGAQINILAVEPFATWAGFKGATEVFAHITMLNDVLAYCEVVDQFGGVISAVTTNLAQGPLMVEEPRQEWQQLGVSALVDSYELFADQESYSLAGNEPCGTMTSRGAEIVQAATGAEYPDAAVTFSARILEAGYRTSALTGQRFIHAVVDGAFPFDVCLPDSEVLPINGNVIKAHALLTSTISAPLAGGGCGGCGGSCGCGGH